MLYRYELWFPDRNRNCCYVSSNCVEYLLSSFDRFDDSETWEILDRHTHQIIHRKSRKSHRSEIKVDWKKEGF